MASQTAIDALRAKQGAANSIDPNFHADTLQAVFDDVTKLGIVRTVAFEYQNLTPVVGTEYDSGYNPAGGAATLEITVAAIITGGGFTNASFDRVSAGALLSNPDVHISRVGEYRGVVGSSVMTFWYSSVTSSIHVIVEFNGGGKTLNQIQVVSSYNSIAIVP